jgi:hypothetical protein
MNNVNYNIQLIQNGPQSILKFHIGIFLKKNSMTEIIFKTILKLNLPYQQNPFFICETLKSQAISFISILTY